MIQRIDISSYSDIFKQATALLSSRKFEIAQIQLKRCLQVNPSSYSAYLNLAYINYLKKNYKLAVKLCDIAINIKPYSSQAYYNRCLSLIMQGRQKYKQASRDISAAISCCYLQSFKKNGEVQQLKKAVAYSQNNIQALRFLIILCHKKQKMQYQKMLKNCQQMYSVSGAIDSVKTLAAGQQGLFRLHGISRLCNIEQIKKQIKQYLTISKHGSNPEYFNPKFQKQSNMLINSNIFDIRVQPASLDTQQNQQQYALSYQRDFGNILSSFSYQRCDRFQLRKSTTFAQIGPLREVSTYHLNVPTDNRFSLVQTLRSPLKQNKRRSQANNRLETSHRYDENNNLNSSHIFSSSRRSRMQDHSITSSRFCMHQGCSKCTRQSQILPVVPTNSIKLQIKTIQIYRNEQIPNPKPYLIIYDGENQHLTEVDHEGGHFPKWNQIFYLHREKEEGQDGQREYRVQLWHKGYKERQDYLIGVAKFQIKKGRVKCYFVKNYGGARKTGYMFIQLGK